LLENKSRVGGASQTRRPKKVITLVGNLKGKRTNQRGNEGGLKFRYGGRILHGQTGEREKKRDPNMKEESQTDMQHEKVGYTRRIEREVGTNDPS